MASSSSAYTWPADHQATRFVVLTEPDQHGLRSIHSLVWVDGCKRMIHQRTSLEALIASARRRFVVFDVVDISAEPETEAA